MASPPAWVDPSRLTRQVWDAASAKSIPGLGRALGIYGMVAQCPLLHHRSIPGVAGSSREELGLPRMLQRPDPDMDLPNFIGVQVEDWLLHGNACHKVTVRRESDNFPAAVRWYPAHRWGLQEVDGQPVYQLDGREVPRDDVVHVRRGADPNFVWRGVGVVEQYLSTWNRAGLEGAAETENLSNRGMPSVVIVQPPGSEFDQDNADKVAEKWEERFGSQKGKPGVFPNGTVVTPLSWNPSDQELTLARKMTLTDMANATNLDPYWLGADGSSHKYQSPSPEFLKLIRISLGPMLRVFEDQWSYSWLPYGRGVLFDRLELLRDDLKTMVETFVKSTGKVIFPDPNEPRRYMGFPELEDSAWPDPPAQLAPPDDTDDEPADDPPADDDDPTEEPAA